MKRKLCAVLEDHPEIRAAITQEDGKIYGLPSGEQMTTAGIGAPMDEAYSIFSVPQYSMINKAWLDDLGLEVPTSLDELHDALKAFKDNDMSAKYYGNAPGSTLPMTTGFDEWCWGQNIFYSGFGFTNWPNDVINDIHLGTDGKVEFVCASDAYRDCLTYFHDWYAEGLMDVEMFSQSDSQLIAKCRQGYVGVSVWWYIEELMGDYAKDYVFLPPLTGPKGTQYENTCGVTIRGKSTTLRMVAGLEEISGGELYIDGKLMNDVEPKNRDIAMVFQSYALYPHMTVYENMAFPLKLRKVPKDEIDRRVRDAAAILDITQFLDRKPKAMSGGQRQRVAIGRAIVREPKVLLMDEPLSNLDAKLRNQMRAEIIKLRQKINTTFIYVTHDQTEAMTLGDRIVIMKDGFVQQVGTPQEVFDHPANLFVAGFIGDYDPDKGFTRQSAQAIDYGLDFYAPQTLEVPDGRQIMIAWMQNWDTVNSKPYNCRWFGQMTLPRELSLKDGQLIQNPVRELESYRRARVVHQNIPVCGEINLPGVQGRVLDMTVAVRPIGPERYRWFRVRVAKDGEHETIIRYRPDQGTLKLDRIRSGLPRDIVHTRSFLVRPRDGEIKLRIILDRYSLEVFVNDGEQAASAVIYTRQEADAITFEAGGSALIDVEKYDLVFDGQEA